MSIGNMKKDVIEYQKAYIDVVNTRDQNTYPRPGISTENLAEPPGEGS